jgi:chromosome segregation ATPase
MSILPSVYGIEEISTQITQLKNEVANEKQNSADMAEKLRQSEQKRHDHLRKNLELQKKILELENELKIQKQRFKELMLKKSSVVLREQFQ